MRKNRLNETYIYVKYNTECCVSYGHDVDIDTLIR